MSGVLFLASVGPLGNLDTPQDCSLTGMRVRQLYHLYQEEPSLSTTSKDPPLALAYMEHWQILVSLTFGCTAARTQGRMVLLFRFSYQGTQPQIINPQSISKITSFPILVSVTNL